VKRRYQYGPTGEVLFDQVFDATGSQGLQGEQDLLLPLGDHQHSTRVVLGNVPDGATSVRQSLDYAQFGRITAIRDAAGTLVVDGAGAPQLSAIVTASAHHGSLLDVTTGLQLKSERWYSPDLGRFISEDPIQDGTNWYMFAGNNPVIYADPTGLYQQGHPLGGGYSGNRTVKPSIPSGNLPAYNVPAARPTTVEQFNRNLSANSNLSQLTRTVDPLKALVQQQRAVNDYRADQAASALRGANANELADIAERNAVRREIRNYEHGVGQVFLGYGDAVTGTAEGLYNVARHPINTITGVATAIAHPIRTGQAIVADFSEKSGSLRGQGAIVGDILSGVVTGGTVKAIKEAGVIGKVAGNVGRLRVGLDANVLKSAQLNSGVPLNAVKVSLAPKVNLNSNIAVSNFGVYDILVDDALQKVGKADLNRITQSTGLPTRIHAQVRKLRALFPNSRVDVAVDNLGATTTSQAKIAETVRLQSHYNQTGVIPVGNQKSFRPNP
jgi:RHS repeat-associated protein